MAKMKLVTDDLDTLADAIARRMAYAILSGLTKNPNAGHCPDCGASGFHDYCFACGFVPFWDRKSDEDSG